jgi:tetratricopeptide (TPR) repeat protein
MSGLFLKKGILAILALFYLTAVSYSQTYQAFAKAGDKSFANNDFYQSAFYYKSALELDSTHLDIAFNYATASRKVNDYKEALHWYAYVYNNSSDTAFGLASFWLGLMKKTEGQYKEAGALFHKFLKTQSKEVSYYSRKAHQEIKACALAEKLALQHGGFIVENAGPSINTQGSDFNGRQVNDSILYFSSVRGHSGYPHIYTSRKENGKWLQAIPATLWQADSTINFANGCFTPDSKSFYCTSCPTDGTQGCGLYRSNLKEGRWSLLKRLSDTINALGAVTTQPSLKTDANGNLVLYFASDRSGGYGKMDLWYSIIRMDGTMDIPVNLGPAINTEDDDIAPFADPQSNAFYFSSEWHSGLGGFDIFKADGTLNQWSVPLNLGKPFNSGYNDLFFTLYKNQGSLTSNRPGGAADSNSTCCNDIYLFHEDAKSKHLHKGAKDSLEQAIAEDLTNTKHKKKVEELQKEAFQKLKRALPVTVYFDNDFPEPKTQKTTCPESYVFYYKEYMAAEPLYLRGYGQEVQLFFSHSVKKGFEDLEAFTRLLLEALESGHSVRLMVAGYCSPLTTSIYNYHLAQRRIASIKNYFNAFSNNALTKFMKPSDGKKPQLLFAETFHGETKAPSTISDKLNDTRNAIYNPAAAAERKVEIQILEME